MLDLALKCEPAMLPVTVRVFATVSIDEPRTLPPTLTVLPLRLTRLAPLMVALVCKVPLAPMPMLVPVTLPERVTLLPLRLTVFEPTIDELDVNVPAVLMLTSVPMMLPLLTVTLAPAKSTVPPLLLIFPTVRSPPVAWAVTPDPLIFPSSDTLVPSNETAPVPDKEPLDGSLPIDRYG